MNPYKILGIERDASQSEIIKGMTSAMRKKEYSARELADAQKGLLNPTTKSAYEFINFIDVTSRVKVENLPLPEKKETRLTLLDIFNL